MENLKDILTITACVIVAIVMIYQMFHMDDLAKGLNELETLKRCMENPKYEKKFLEYHSKLIKGDKIHERKISKWKMRWVVFCAKHNLHL